MKKVVALVISLLLLVAPISSLAELKPIDFRGIEWKSTFVEVEKLLASEGINLSSKYHGSQKNVEAIIKDNTKIFDHDAYFHKSSWYNSKDIIVAGYEIEQIKAYFAYQTAENRKEPISEENSVFFMAVYEFAKVSDYNAVIEDLKNKLTYLYGEISEMRAEGSVIDHTLYKWIDANGNGLILHLKEYTSEIKYIYLWYFSSDADDLIKKSYEAVKAQALAEEAKKFGLDNLDGL